MLVRRRKMQQRNSAAAAKLPTTGGSGFYNAPGGQVDPRMASSPPVGSMPGGYGSYGAAAGVGVGAAYNSFNSQQNSQVQ